MATAQLEDPTYTGAFWYQVSRKKDGEATEDGEEKAWAGRATNLANDFLAVINKDLFSRRGTLAILFSLKGSVCPQKRTAMTRSQPFRGPKGPFGRPKATFGFTKTRFWGSGGYFSSSNLSVFKRFLKNG